MGTLASRGRAGAGAGRAGAGRAARGRAGGVAARVILALLGLAGTVDVTKIGVTPQSLGALTVEDGTLGAFGKVALLGFLWSTDTNANLVALLDFVVSVLALVVDLLGLVSGLGVVLAAETLGTFEEESVALLTSLLTFVDDMATADTMMFLGDLVVVLLHLNELELALQSLGALTVEPVATFTFILLGLGVVIVVFRGVTWLGSGVSWGRGIVGGRSRSVWSRSRRSVSWLTVVALSRHSCDESESKEGLHVSSVGDDV